MKTTKVKSDGRRRARASKDVVPDVSAGSKILAAIEEATDVLRKEGLGSKRLTVRTYKAAPAPRLYRPAT